ncbi:uncharacterized protein FA14DRAFT_171713 [Meira miltonrushii]|uniref:Uncharacterized protein n=1 Tax=Meira miltonrushii TaxID=1280837 RepID=A0A316VHN6_9BASI|nr:uncharacterized protein FA14DRAFT_171713 [Meira miltonrushii]PWN35015.1 hypothetical protein FA14DRAFT_171713 [Meira miltonrushii]
MQDIDCIICTIDENAKYNLYPLLTGIEKAIFEPIPASITTKPFNLLPTIGDWMMHKFNFRHDCRVVDSISDLMASYLSCPVGPEDILVQLSTSDELLVPIRSDQHGDASLKFLSNPFFVLNDHKTNHNGHRPFLAQIRCQGFGKARNTIREEYTKTWKAFKQLVQVVSPGGTAGLDDKLFLFFLFDDQDDLQSVRRYEVGTCVSEFNDLRANPRSTLEGQALYVRKRLSELRQKDSQTTVDKTIGYWGASNCLPFKPFDKKSIPNKCWITSNETSKVETECIADVMGQVVGAQCFLNGGNEELAIPQSCIGAVYFCLFQQYLDRGQPEISYEDFVRSFQQQQSLHTPTGSTTASSSPTASHTTMVEEHQRTPRASRRRPSLFNSPHVHFSLDKGSSGDSTPTLRNRANRAISSAAAMLKDNDSIQDVESTPRLRQRQRSVSLSASTIYSSPPSSTFGQVLSPPNSLHSELTNEGEEDLHRISTEFSSIDSSDEDLWLFYGAMLEEYVRLWDSIHRNRTNTIKPSS